MPGRASRSTPSAARRIAVRVGSLLAAGALVLGPLALTGLAAESLEMSARVLLQGHARAGAWTAIEVDLKNDGPPIRGELQMDAGEQGTARYSMAVDLPTGSHQAYVLHAQPPQFGRNVTINLVADGQKVESVSVAYLVHEQAQLVVGVMAEDPGGLISQIDLPTGPLGGLPAIVPLTLEDLPGRVEGWAALDRLVWQDIDSGSLSSDQLEAMRRWIAAGGRLVIVGGSAGIGTLSGFPDDMLPFRPIATIDADPASLRGLLGPAPAGAADVPAMAGPLARGRAIASVGDRAVAADLAYGSGRVTILGFDTSAGWLAEAEAVAPLWRGLLPQRTSDGTALQSDNELLNAVYQLPSLALPPTEGLLAIIGAYILIIGPINYLVLKRLDRRELAWITMPVLVLGFAAAAFGYGALLRGTDVVVNEIAIVHAAPDATEASGQVYFGVFSPTRQVYRVDVPQYALLAAPINSDIIGVGNASLDILQGTGPQNPSAVRNLAVGTGSIRIVRAQLPVTAPRMRATLRLENGTLSGTFENASDTALENVAVVLGSSVLVLGDVGPGQSRQVALPIRDNPFSALADMVVGQAFDRSDEEAVRRSARYSMVSQLTYDPMGRGGRGLAAEQPVIIAFGRDQLLDVRVGSESPRRIGNVLYYLPVSMTVGGHATFGGDLLRSTVVEADAQFFDKDRFYLNLGTGKAALAYRPIEFEGSFRVTAIRLALNAGEGVGPLAEGKVIEPLPSIPVACTDAKNTLPEGCEPRRNDFLPEVEIFDRRGDGAWVRLPRLAVDAAYSIASPERYADPATGEILVRFVNENLEATSFGFRVAIEGDIE